MAAARARHQWQRPTVADVSPPSPEPGQHFDPGNAGSDFSRGLRHPHTPLATCEDCLRLKFQPGADARGRNFLVFLSAVAVISLVGCHTGAELVEAELRRKERENEQLSQKLRDCECEVRLLQGEYERLLRDLRSAGKVEARGLVYLKGITLGRLTGGLDDDPDCPGDDALLVVLEPRDLDDQVVKVPGHVHVDAYEITPQGLKQPLSGWDIPARELRGQWETPLFGSPAYRLVLRWKVLPHYDRLRVVVRFTTLDGQMFETDRDVTIRLPRRDPDRCRVSPSDVPVPRICTPRPTRPSPAWLGIPPRGQHLPFSVAGTASPYPPGTSPVVTNGPMDRPSAPREGQPVPAPMATVPRTVPPPSPDAPEGGPAPPMVNPPPAPIGPILIPTD